MRAAALFLLLGPGLLPQDQPAYQWVEIYQIQGEAISERPVSTATVLRIAGFYERLESQAAVDTLAARLSREPDTDLPTPRNIRLVGLLHRAGGTDTLLIDTWQNCRFRGRSFKLDSLLAQALTVQDGINPQYARAGTWLCVCHDRPETVATASIRPAPNEQGGPYPEKAVSYFIAELTDAAT